MDIFNAMSASRLNIHHTEEMFAEKDYDYPFWISLDEQLKGATATREHFFVSLLLFIFLSRIELNLLP